MAAPQPEPAVHAGPWTLEEWLALPEDPPYTELVDGLLVTSPVSGYHGQPIAPQAADVAIAELQGASQSERRAGTKDDTDDEREHRQPVAPHHEAEQAEQEHFLSTGRTQVTLKYGFAGRPERLYYWQRP